MRTVAPRRRTPVSDSPAVEPSSTRDLTEPEAAPPTRRTPVAGVSQEPMRSRTKTLVSPIPALLAASMREIREDKEDATPLPIDLRSDSTSRVDELELRNLLFADESEYVVEVVESSKSGR